MATVETGCRKFLRSNIKKTINFTHLSIPDLVVIEPQIFGDNRGFFYEAFRSDFYAQSGIKNVNFIQLNRSRSTKSVLRGLHMQRPPFTQDKLVWVINGSVLDVAVDARPNSPTFGQWEAVELTGDNHKLFFVPKGFLHGFIVLSESVDFEYLVSNLYNQESELGVVWNDPNIGINWQVSDPILSDKDKLHPLLKDIKSILPQSYET